MSDQAHDHAVETGTTEPASTGTRTRRIVFYARTSSEDQRERETIKTQIDELHRALARAERVALVGECYDDGVSGTIAMEKRPQGRLLLDWCRRGLVDEVWVTRPNRIGRTTIHILNAVDAIESFGVVIVGVLDPMEDRFILTIKAAVAEEERRVLLENSGLGMDRAAREGRYLGGIVPLGYRVEGKKETARLVPSDILMWGDLTEADVARLIFTRLVEGKSCTKIAREFNALGIPTAYGKDGRGIRGRSTQQVWRPNRIYSLATNTTYRGEQRFGEHSKKPGGREVISAEVPRLVSDEVWYAAQETLHGLRFSIPTGTRRAYLLRRLIRCSACGQGYYGQTAQDRPSLYRCGGQSVARRPRARSVHREVHQVRVHRQHRVGGHRAVPARSG